MHVWVCAGLKGEEFAAEEGWVYGEGAGRGGAKGEGVGEEGVVGFLMGVRGWGLVRILVML